MQPAAGTFTPPLRDTVASVAQALEKVAPGIRITGASRWTVDDPTRRHARATIGIDGEWLMLERPLKGATLTRLALARRTGLRALSPALELPAGMRPVLAEGSLRACLRAERALSPTCEPEDQSLLHWLDRVLNREFVLVTGCEPGAREATLRMGIGHPLEGDDIAALCETARWQALPRGGTRDHTVELPARGDSVCRAVISPEGAGLRLRVALAPDDEAPATPACQSAAAVALLLTAGLVRTVRATATHGDAGLEAALDIHLEPPLSAEALNHALSALAVAHQQVANEFASLAGDDALARAYLSLQGVR